MYVTTLKTVIPIASQKAAHTESSTREEPALFTLAKGSGAPLRAHPILHVNKNNAHASAVTLVVHSSITLTKSTAINTPQ
jgi:hypothetical protein